MLTELLRLTLDRSTGQVVLKTIKPVEHLTYSLTSREKEAVHSSFPCLV
jgi:hypothetical protein